ncbi:MAG: GNAT family N-acetyltransferase [Bacteroidota bacterium]|jgi:ribosomal protein S18 acetylase RimI-like enzyme|nr:GNAT family N-acetyltransferase [Bacteroidota bacterium]
MKDAYTMVSCSWKHHAALAEIGASTFYETFAADNTEEDMQAYIGKTYAPKQIALNLAEPNIHYYLIYQGTEVMGYIKTIVQFEVEKLEGKTLELEKIYLRKEAHGSGMAKVLMDAAIQLARTEKANNLYLGVWQENERALAFYKKSGFEIYNTRQFKLGARVCEDFLLRLRIVSDN